MMETKEIINRMLLLIMGVATLLVVACLVSGFVGYGIGYKYGRLDERNAIVLPMESRPDVQADRWDPSKNR